ncbi:MAG: nucleotide exchange factor GrpE [Rickettsiella sp.]|nr:nucleotide exchange factor GrpE [Rickettsiella sp.]
MSKDINSKKKTWEKLSQVDTDASDKESVLKEESSPEKKTESPPNKLTHPTYEALEEQLSKTEAELEEYKNKLIQSYADLQNKEKRFERQIESIHKFSQEELLSNLLPIKDNLEKAVALLISKSKVEKDPTLEGIQLTLKDLQKVLEKNGVKTIDPASGESFDAHYHQAMTTKESTEQTPNTILEVLQKGYLLNGRLLRPAWVVVAKAIEEKT